MSRAPSNKAKATSSSAARASEDDVIPLSSLMSEAYSQAEFLELVYLSSEKDLLTLMRQISQLDDRTRDVLRAFFSHCKSPQQITAAFEDKTQSVLVLRAPSRDNRPRKPA